MAVPVITAPKNLVGGTTTGMPKAPVRPGGRKLGAAGKRSLQSPPAKPVSMRKGR